MADEILSKYYWILVHRFNLLRAWGTLVWLKIDWGPSVLGDILDFFFFNFSNSGNYNFAAMAHTNISWGTFLIENLKNNRIVL